MSQHSQRTQAGPGVTSIAVAAALTIASLFATGYVSMTWPEYDGPAVVAIALGLTLTGMLAYRVLGLALDRVVAQDRVRREAEREKHRQARQEAARARDTGLWTGRGGQSLSVRWDPSEGRYHVQGWLSETWDVPEEIPWRDVATLAQILGELEHSGEARPADGEGTRAVRARLGLPAWNEFEPVAEVEPADERGLSWAQAWRVYEANHPEVVASWAKQNGRWPSCRCAPCGLGGEPVAGLVDQRVPVPLPPRHVEPDPLGYQADPERPWRAFVPVSPGRADPDDTQVIDTQP